VARRSGFEVLLPERGDERYEGRNPGLLARGQPRDWSGLQPNPRWLLRQDEDGWWVISPHIFYASAPCLDMGRETIPGRGGAYSVDQARRIEGWDWFPVKKR